MHQRQLGPFAVNAIGLGCMNICHAYGNPVPKEQAERFLRTALDVGVTHFDTAALYGFGVSEALVGQVLGSHRQKFTLASKCGMTVEEDGNRVRQGRVIDGRPETLRATCEGSLKRLKTDVIDLYYLHRWDKSVPIEESVGALSDLVREGKIRTIGLSEVSATTLRKAHKEHPITAVQTEYSLWTRNPEIAVLAACRELGVSFVAFSPVARGFLCDAVPDVSALPDKDIRRAMPRFSAANYPKNLALLGPYRKMAQELGCTPAQLALAWLLHQGQDILPIPGTANEAHLVENMAAADIVLSEEVLARLNDLINQRTVSGNRYSEQSAKEVDTEALA